MTEHAQEPWRVRARFWIDAEKSFVATADKQEIAPHEAEANARRIVACVNACAGIPTEALVSGQIRLLEVERPSVGAFDMLGVVASLKAMFSIAEDAIDDDGCSPDYIADIAKARTVLAKLRGGG